MPDFPDRSYGATIWYREVEQALPLFKVGH